MHGILAARSSRFRRDNDVFTGLECFVLDYAGAITDTLPAV
jgi:hypothetical protein